MEIDKFGEILMRAVRDAAVRDCDSDLSDEASTARALRWRAARARGELINLRAAVPEIVDTVLFHLLAAIDSGQLRLAYNAAEEGGDFVDLSVLASEQLGFDSKAEVSGIEGWRDRFAQERFFDDLAELRARMGDPPVPAHRLVKYED